MVKQTKHAKSIAGSMREVQVTVLEHTQETQGEDMNDANTWANGLGGLLMLWLIYVMGSALEEAGYPFYYVFILIAGLFIVPYVFGKFIMNPMMFFNLKKVKKK